MTVPELYAVIMAGGSGTRFWPASRKPRPKQFLTIAGERPMIAETAARLEGLIPPERTIVVAGASQIELVREALPDLPEENLLIEPVGRNTLPCVALAAFEIRRRSPDAVQIVLPADHVIEPHSAFRESLEQAAALAAEGTGLVTFGMHPTFAATGYGYIETGQSHGDHGAMSVRRFVEKPNADVAQDFLASGRFLWNSGIFVWSTASICAELAQHAPLVTAALADAGSADLAEIYPGLPAESVDVGIMEKADRVYVLPIEYRWSDVGSWAALPDVHEQDANDNTVTGGGRLVAEDATGCVVYGDSDKLTALIGVQDLIVVHSDGATLVCPRDRAQDVKKIVEELKRVDPTRI